MKENKNPEQWEVVGGKTKDKSKVKTVKKNGVAEKSNQAAPPVLYVEDLVTPLDSQYAMLDPELKAQARRQAMGLPALKPEKPKPKVPAVPVKEPVVKKKPAKETSKPPKSLAEALKQLNEAEINDVVETMKARFPKSPLLQLKELNNTLNNNLPGDVDPSFSGKPRDYPSSALSSGIRNTIVKTIQSCGDEALHSFYDQCVITVPTEINRGASVCGTKIILQLIAFHKPELVLSHLDRARETLVANESRIPVTVSLLWILSQSSFKDARVGIQVWLEAMLPLVGMKHYCQYVAQLAGYVTGKVPGNKLPGLSVQDYFKLGDVLGTLPSQVKGQISEFFSSLTLPMISSHGSKMFGQYLKRLSTSDDQSTTCRHLLDCLKADEHSYEVWRKEYKSQLISSSILLDFMANNKIEKTTSFRTTLTHFQTVNATLTPSSKVRQELLDNLNDLVESLATTSKPKKTSIWKRLNYMLILGLIGVLVYDYRVNAKCQFSQSKLAIQAERYGLNAKLAQVHKQIEPYLITVGERAVFVKDVVYNKGEELYPGVWAALDEKWSILALKARQQWAVVSPQLSEWTAKCLATVARYWTQFDDWSSDYRRAAVVQAEKALEITAVYVKQARQWTVQLMDREDVKYAVSYTYDMYHKALHAVGLCSH